jgi:hypothetical protein
MANEKSTLSGGGKAGGILRRVDWPATSLGNPEAWPEPLRISLRINPMLIWWGGELVREQFTCRRTRAAAGEHRVRRQD